MRFARLLCALSLLSGCAILRRPPAAPAPPGTVEQPGPGGTTTTAPTRPNRVPRGAVAEADKPEWMRGLLLPELSLRWYP